MGRFSIVILVLTLALDGVTPRPGGVWAEPGKTTALPIDDDARIVLLGPAFPPTAAPKKASPSPLPLGTVPTPTSWPTPSNSDAPAALGRGRSPVDSAPRHLRMQRLLC